MTSVLHFDGQSNYIRIPHQESLSPVNNFTFEAWLNAGQIGGYLRLFSKFPGFGFGLINEALLFTEYWIVDYLGLGGRRYIGDPKQPTISIYHLVEGEYVLQVFRGKDIVRSPCIPELGLTAESIFGSGGFVFIIFLN